MQIDTYSDGSFRFIFPKNEKRLGLELLQCLSTENKKDAELIEFAKYRIIMAGVLTDKPLPK
jgi:hypothetical protein